ncbi:XRE family transcriptional regulator [Mediterraneibacter faecis]|uniref:XRE family transcriptional regulator n=1 Tax=Mediterraneibacter faecis TaxID=592978 RepID=UPI003F9451BE
MTSKELIKMLMNEKDMTNADMAKQLGISQAALWDRLNKQSNNMSIAKMNSMIELLGYKIVLVPKETPIPDNGYEVE